MREFFLAEKMKYRHTAMSRIVFFMPLSCVVMSAWLTHIYFFADSYNWWYVGLYPGFIGILCGMLGNKEKRKRNSTIGSLPCSMGKIWDVKILMGAVMSLISIICIVVLTLLVGEGMKMGLHVEFLAVPSLGEQVLAGILMWLTTLWEIPFCILLVQKLGSFLMLAFHMTSYVVLAAVISLKPWFPLFPGAITARLMCPVLGVMPNGLLLQPGQMTYSSRLAAPWVVPVGVLASLLWFGLFWIISRKWFERQVTAQ